MWFDSINKHNHQYLRLVTQVLQGFYNLISRSFSVKLMLSCVCYCILCLVSSCTCLRCISISLDHTQYYPSFFNMIKKEFYVPLQSFCNWFLIQVVILFWILLLCGQFWSSYFFKETKTHSQCWYTKVSKGNFS